MGGLAQVKYEGENWKDVFNNENPTWHGVNYFMMRDSVEYRIKPRKEKRYLMVQEDGACTSHFSSKEEALGCVCEKDDRWQLIEIEVEI